MEKQYIEAFKQTAPRHASQLCSRFLQTLFEGTDYKITPEFEFQDGHIAPFVVERIWDDGRRSPLLVVNVRCRDQLEDEDAERDEEADEEADKKADDDLDQYVLSAIDQSSRYGQTQIFAACWIGDKLMLYVFRAQQEEVVAMADDYMDVKNDFAAIKDLVRKIQNANLFE